MPKIPLYPPSVAPNDDDWLILEDSVTSNTKKIKRSDFLGGNTITATNDIKTDEIIGIADADSGVFYGITVTNKQLSTTNSVPQAAISALSGEGAVRSKSITFTRDGTAASGDVQYTGVGFIPSSIIAFAVVDNSVYSSDGIADSAKTSYCKFTSASGTFYFNNTSLISYSNQTSWAQTAIVKSYDADGFTLTWTKVGSPTAGTIKVFIICYR